jgi:NAD-dependent SIR2 family protein deacetylase
VITFKCSKCGHEYKVDDVHAGKKARCKSCENVNAIPAAAAKPAVTGRGPGSGDTVANYNSLLQELLKQEKTAPSVEIETK